jgi:hypothetical protein
MMIDFEVWPCTWGSREICLQYRRALIDRYFVQADLLDGSVAKDCLGSRDDAADVVVEGEFGKPVEVERALVFRRRCERGPSRRRLRHSRRRSGILRAMAKCKTVFEKVKLFSIM